MVITIREVQLQKFQIQSDVTEGSIVMVAVNLHPKKKASPSDAMEDDIVVVVRKVQPWKIFSPSDVTEGGCCEKYSDRIHKLKITPFSTSISTGVKISDAIV